MKLTRSILLLVCECKVTLTKPPSNAIRIIRVNKSVQDRSVTNILSDLLAAISSFSGVPGSTLEETSSEHPQQPILDESIESPTCAVALW